MAAVLRHDWTTWLFGAMALLASVAVGAADKGLREVRDPHYGEGLFYFYQQRYFSALTHLMASQHFQRLPHDADNAELLRGGLMLSYGLHREAGDIFGRLIDTGAAPAVRDRAWFFLGKIRYQRGYLDEAGDALGRIGADLPAPLDEERRLLEANVRMAQGDYARAVEVLTALPRKSDTLLYGRYNLGVAMVKSGQADAGVAQLEEVGRMAAKTEELRALRDKANVALGYASLQADKPEKAKEYLERVRLTGMLANKALLGFGWAQLALDKPREALVPWSELAERGLSDAAVLEAKLAVPYALGKIGAHSNSLQEYEAAIGAFGREDTRLDASIASIRAGRLLEAVLAANPGPEMGWFWSISELPDLPLREQMAEALAQHEFQEALKNYRDLRFVADNLDQWNDSLGAFRDILAARRQAYVAKLPRVLAGERALGLARFEEEDRRLGTELARVESESDVGAFADDKERTQRERLLRIETILKRAGTRPDVAEATDRYRRVRGALLWQLTAKFPERLWESKKGLKTLEAEIVQARGRHEALSQAQREMPAKFDGFAERIADLGRRTKELVQRAEELKVAQQHFVEELAVAELEAQKRRLATYVTQAQFAVAQIYDQAARAEENNAPPP
jgi:hypothetical protein